MDFKSLFYGILPTWKSLVFIGVRVIFIAVVFEFLTWLVAKRVDKHAQSFLSLDSEREAKWRATRRMTLKKAPKSVARALLYTIAFVLVFNEFGLPVLPLSLSVGAIALIVGSGLLPTVRDYAQGYSLLSEDTLAPGDVVEIGAHTGTVEKWTLRATWLRDAQGRVHVLSNSGIRDVTIISRAAAPVGESGAMAPTGTFDPLDAAKPRRPLPKK